MLTLRRRDVKWQAGLVASLCIACGTDVEGQGDFGASQGTGSGVDAASAGADDVSSTGADTDSGPKLDVGHPDTSGGPQRPSCKVEDGAGDAIVPCRSQAPPDSFTPVVEWAWMGADGYDQVVVTPLVANLTDDNGDGEIDLCDTPDIVVVAYDDCDAGECLGVESRLYVLDGATGEVHYAAQTAAMSGSMRTPAIGDVDNDGLPEIVMPTAAGGIAALEHDGALKWTSGVSGAALGIADLDNDGHPEIYDSEAVWKADGTVVATFLPQGGPITAADLDGDGDLELVHGPTAFHHDGSIYYTTPQVSQTFGAGTQIADVDGDPEPEIILTSFGISILEHDGTPKVVSFPNTDSKWARPAAIHDMDGDGQPELAAGSGWHYNVLEFGPFELAWSTSVLDQSSAASGTAFDFLGDGNAEAMYADEETLFIFDGSGAVAMSAPRTSWTDIELPVVADVDNDGSAEIVVVSNKGYIDGANPAVQVIGDQNDRWIQARRIWNQHTYHVTNVREDATIPQFEQPSWAELNTFRTQSQIESGVVCIPPAG